MIHVIGLSKSVRVPGIIETSAQIRSIECEIVCDVSNRIFRVRAKSVGKDTGRYCYPLASWVSIPFEVVDYFVDDYAQATPAKQPEKVAPKAA